MQIGRTKDWREARGLTQRELAHEAGVGEVTVARLEGGSSVAAPTARKIADALNVEVIDLMDNPPLPAPKADAPATGPLEEILRGVGTRTRHLADAGLVDSLEAASDAALERTVREIRQELEVLLPGLRRLRGRVKPGDHDYMVFNRAVADATRQVLVLNMLLRERGGTEPQAEEIAGAARELVAMAAA